MQILSSESHCNTPPLSFPECLSSDLLHSLSEDGGCHLLDLVFPKLFGKPGVLANQLNAQVLPLDSESIGLESVCLTDIPGNFSKQWALLGPRWSPCLRSLPYQSSPALLQKCLPEMYQSLLCHTELKLCNIINRVWCGHYLLLYLVSFPVFPSSNNTNCSSNLRIPLFFHCSLPPLLMLFLLPGQPFFPRSTWKTPFHPTRPNSSVLPSLKLSLPSLELEHMFIIAVNSLKSLRQSLWLAHSYRLYLQQLQVLGKQLLNKQLFLCERNFCENNKAMSMKIVFLLFLLSV